MTKEKLVQTQDPPPFPKRSGPLVVVQRPQPSVLLLLPIFGNDSETTRLRPGAACGPLQALSHSNEDGRSHGTCMFQCFQMPVFTLACSKILRSTRRQMIRCSISIARFSTAPSPPIQAQLLANKDYFWCTCSKSLKQVLLSFSSLHAYSIIITLAAVLRRQPQRQRHEVAQVQRTSRRSQIPVRLQAHQEPSILRRFALEARTPQPAGNFWDLASASACTQRPCTDTAATAASCTTNA